MTGVEAKEPHVSNVAVHDSNPEHVRLIHLKPTSYCLAVGPIDLYGTLAELRALVGRASELIERALSS